MSRRAGSGRAGSGAQRALPALLAVSLLLGCAKGSAPAKSPTPDPPASSSEPAPAPTPVPEPEALTLPPLGAGVPGPEASCPQALPLTETRTACPSGLADLAKALQEPASSADAALTPLEACAEFAPGVIRALPRRAPARLR